MRTCRQRSIRKRGLKEPLAYYVVVHALEAEAGWNADRRFAAAVSHAVDGHLAYPRYHAAGRARAREGIGEEGVQRLVRDFLETDLNPAIAFLANLNRAESALRGYNLYNATANLAVRTSVDIKDQGQRGVRRLAAERDLRTRADDPSPCRTATLTVAASVIEHVQSGGTCLSRPLSVSHLAEILGRGYGIGADVARAIEDDWLAPLSLLPRKLGCHKRTLERSLRDVGLTAQALRRADRMMRATAGLFSGHTLTSIAADCGFSDAAHMSRSFRASCGLTPTMLVEIARDDRNANGWESRLPYGRPHGQMMRRAAFDEL